MQLPAHFAALFNPLGRWSILAIALIPLLLSSNSQAQWIEATGTAMVRNGDQAAAKNKAVQNAIRDALMFAGVSISSVQQVSAGLLTQDDFRVTSHGSIQQLELVEELYQQGQVSVTIRADVIPQDKQCFSADFQKSVAITQFSLNDRENAKTGGLYQLGKIFSRHLFDQLHKDSGTILARPWLEHKLDSRLNFNQYYDADMRMLETIGESSDSQFVLLGQIVDLSFGTKTSNDLMFWQNKTNERYFVVDLMIFNTSTKEQIYRQQFDTVGSWQQEQQQRINPAGRHFWQSPYGSSVANLINDIQAAIEEVVHCQPVQGKILKVDGNQIQFNLGKEHGVSKGQVFAIIHRSHFITDSGKHLPQFVISPYHVKVSDVYTKTSIASSMNNELLGNIQTTDHVILQEIPEPQFE